MVLPWLVNEVDLLIVTNDCEQGAIMINMPKLSDIK